MIVALGAAALSRADSWPMFKNLPERDSFSSTTNLPTTLLQEWAYPQLGGFGDLIQPNMNIATIRSGSGADRLCCQTITNLFL